VPSEAAAGGVGVASPALAAFLATELKITAAALMRNPKSYSAWHHRAWVVANWTDSISLPDELALCGRMLDADERNFHCWNYRR